MSNATGHDGRDARLGRLLRSWQAVEPRADFDQRVWRRLRAASGPRVVAFWETLRAGALAAAAAVVVGAMVGLWLPAPARSRPPATPLLHRHSAAGAYLAMASGDIQ